MLNLIRYRALAYVLSLFLMALAAVMLVPLGYGLLADRHALTPLAYAAAITMLVGGLLYLLCHRHTEELTQREGLLVVVVIWLAVCLFGALPFYFSPYFDSFTSAYFEAVSGFSTTGATVLDDVEILPEPLQFWRCFTHWLGGMGIVLLGVAVLPIVGHGGLELYRAEFSGARSERLKPRVAETASALWKIYFALTAGEYLALRLAGMNNFDALCHTFSTLGTGGFSTRTASVAAFDNPAVEYIIVVFMLLAGLSFVQHYRLWVERRPGKFLADVEIRAYLMIVAVVTLIIFASLIVNSGYAPELALRRALFQVSSIATTTGFVTDDFELWAPLPQLLLLALMIVGGCTGSTAGGIKVSRMLLLTQVVNREFRKMVERHGVFVVRLGDNPVPERTVQSLLNLLYLAVVVFFVACFLLAMSGVEVFTAIVAVLATTFNIGPGLGDVGPLDNYGDLPASAQWVLTLCMIAGRLEFYTLLVILTPAFWRR